MASESNDEPNQSIALAASEKDICASELLELTYGSLEPELLERLRMQAQADPELAAAIEAHEPISEAMQEYIAARVIRELKADPMEARSSTLADKGIPVGFVNKRGRRMLGVSIWAPLLAAAAALLMIQISDRVDPLAHYSLEVVPFRSEMRHSTTPRHVLALAPTLGEDVEIVLRPDAVVDGPVRVVATLISEHNGPAIIVPTQVEVSGRGSIRVRFSWPSSPARGRLVILVARPQEQTSERTLSPASEGRGWQRFELPFEVRSL